MKETGTVHWSLPNTGATNSSGFTGLPGGCSTDAGTFGNIHTNGYFLSSTENSSTYVDTRTLLHNSAYITLDVYSPKDFGFSVRCLMD